MRLRSSQFVFLLLLVCSVQTREDFALHLIAGAPSGRTSAAPELRELQAAVTARDLPSSLPVVLAASPAHLDAASLATHGTPWSMRRPALDAAAVSSFTSFLRA